MLGEMMFAVPSALSVALAAIPFVVLGVIAALTVLGLVSAVWSVVPADERRAIRWLGAGSLASLLVSVADFPIAAPAGASLGGSLVLGTVLRYGWAKIESAVPRSPCDASVGSRCSRSTSCSRRSFSWARAACSPRWVRRAEIDASLDGVLPGPGLVPKAPPAVFLVASDPLAGMYVGAARAVRAPGTSSAWCMLSMTRATHDVRRVDDRTIVIETDRPMLHGAYDGVFRDVGRAPLHAGWRFDSTGRR